MDNNKFDFLIPTISNEITIKYFDILRKYPEFSGDDIDTSPLLNLTMGVFVSSIRQVLVAIKESTEGEQKLFNHIDLAEKGLLKFFEDLPFVTKVESF